MSASETRSIDLEIAINAPVATIWNALIDPEQLANWFPLYAEGGSNIGDALTVGWGPNTEWTVRLDAVEPNEHLRWVDPPSGDEHSAPKTAVDFYVEQRGSSTVVRLVHSGFDASSDWDEYYDSTLGGWTYFLHNLRHYLETHPKRTRHMVFARRSCADARPAAWQHLFGSNGFNVSGFDPTIGRSFSGHLGDTTISGTIQLARAPFHLAVSFETLNDALMFVEFEPGAPSWHCGIWISTYGLDAEHTEGLQTALDALASSVFGLP